MRTKKILIWTVIIATIFCTTGILIYRLYLPRLVANAITSKNELPTYVPRYIKARINKYKTPVNKSAEAVIKKMHEENIPLDDVIEAIDEAKEEQVYALLEELNRTKIKSTNQVFDIAIKHFPVDFNAEAFREPFNQHVDMKMVKKGLTYANMAKQGKSIDPNIAKAVLKKILLEKEREMTDDSL